MNCSYCGAPEKEPREGNTAWYTCGTYGPAMAPGRTFRSVECYLHEDIRELNKEIAELRNEIERLKNNQPKSE